MTAAAPREPTSPQAPPRGLLVDLDGTLYVGDQPLPSAPEAVARLAREGVPRRFITNTTRVSRATLTERLRDLGFPVRQDELFTAPVATHRWLEEAGIRRVALYLPEAAHEDFAGLDLDDEAPEAVVVGDLGEGWSFARLNQAFRQLVAGARLVAIQKNRYWRRADGLTLDAGPFVAALEHATRQEAVVVGKPSRAFFELAAGSLGLAPAEVVMIGDDVESDVGGAQAAGLGGALVRSGKFSEETLERSGVEPDWAADSLMALVEGWYP